MIAASILVSACASSEHARPTKPPGTSPVPRELIAEGERTDCGEPSFRRFADRQGRVSFCAPAGSQVGWLRTVEEKNTIEEMWLAPDTSSNFSVTFLARAPDHGIGPGAVPEGGAIDFDETATLAGREARHFRMRWHDHRNRSSVIDEHGRHSHEEASDHDVVVERWSLPWKRGTLNLTLRTQENTSDATKRLFARMQSSFRFELP